MISRAERNQSKRTAETTVRLQLDFIKANMHHLRKKDRGGKMEQAAKDFLQLLDQGKNLTPNQMSYINGIYERVMDNAGFGGAGNVHKKKNKAGLRYG